MINKIYLSYMILLLVLMIIYFNFDRINNKLSFLFSKKPKIKTELICPKCGSTNWKVPTPLKSSESMINVYHLVNQLSECNDCGYIGIFYSADKKSISKLKLRPTKKTKEHVTTIAGKQYNYLVNFFEVILFVIVFYLLIAFSTLLWGTLMGLVIISLYKKFRYAK